jgi:multidrug efflux pump subunit AcrA (membrane-fusion protein)
MEQEPEKSVERVGLGRKLFDVISILVALAVLGGAIFISYRWLTTRPRSRRRPPPRISTLVEVQSAQRTAFQVEVTGMGTVVPARRVTLAARVAGHVTAIDPELAPGGRLRKGAAAVTLDREDFELAVTERRNDLARRKAEWISWEHQLIQRKAAVVQAESNLDLEMARQAVARKEAELLGEKLTPAEKDLVLRKPQLDAARASLASAKAALAAAEASMKIAAQSRDLAKVALRKAELNLARTTVPAPFNAVVLSRNVDQGAQVSAGSPMATLVGTDAFWVEVAVPLGELRWISLPRGPEQRGPAVRLYHEAAWGAGVHRTGYVKRLAAGLEPRGRMARLVVEVADPLCLLPENAGKPVLMLDAYVRAAVQGSRLENVVRLPRLALRDGDKVWVMGREEKLEIRRVSIVWRGRDAVCVEGGLAEGERLVTSDIGAPVAGMPLRLEGAKPRKPGSPERGGGPGRRPGGPPGSGPGSGRKPGGD